MNKRLSTQQARNTAKALTLMDIVCLLLPMGAFLLWYLALGDINISKMNDLGLVSVMPPTLIAALMIMMVSFCLTLQQPRLHTPILLLHFAILICMLFATTTLVEQAPRFNIVYRHAGYTEYIMRTGTVDPNLDAYFNWPGFFALSAFVTRIAGYQDILSYAAWAPVFYNVIYLGPLYILFTTFTLNKRVIWLSMWIFCITNWIAQDYFSPQGLDFFLYLLILALLLKWFKTPPFTRTLPLWPRLSRIRFLASIYSWLTTPDPLYIPIQPLKRIALLASILIIFFFIVFGHQLTPFFVLTSVTLLIFFQRCPLKLWWLPIIMALMTAWWIIFMAQTYLAGHLNDILGGLGHLLNSFSANVADRVSGSPEHTFIARIRIIMTFLLWALALVGALFRLRKGYKDASVVILAIAPFPLFIVQPYGGEMLLRCYLFSQPSMVFFAAALCYNIPSFTFLKKFSRTENSKRFPWAKGIAISSLLLVLMSGFLFTRYGNESMDYKTYDEVNGVFYLYNNSQANSLFIAGWDGTPWQVKDFEKFQLYTLSDTNDLANAVGRLDVHYVEHFIQNLNRRPAYIIFTRSQKATFDATSGFPAGTLDRFESAVQASGDFDLIYQNHDAQIFQLINFNEGGQ